MSEPSHSDLQDDPEFQAILAECLEALERGETLDLQAIQMRHPQYAADFREFLEDHELLRQMATVERDDMALDPTLDSGRTYNGVALGESIQYIG